MIGRKWIYSDSERSTFHRVWALQRVSVAAKCGMVRFHRLTNFIC